MKWLLRVVGVLMVLLGLVWVGQGLGLVPGSFMTGQIAWAWRGLLTLLIGAGLLYLSTQRFLLTRRR